MGLVMLVLVIAVLYWAIRTLPWWVLLLGVVALAAAVRWILPRMVGNLLLIPFKMKSAVLRGARAELHSVKPVVEPVAREPETGEPDGPHPGGEENEANHRSFEVDVTIRPARARGKFTHWGPGELELIQPTTPSGAKNRESDDACRISRVTVEEDGSFVPDEGMKYEGPCRLRLLVHVRPGVNRLAFRYYFERFGEVLLPEDSRAA